MLLGPGEAVAMETKIPPLTPRTRQKMSQAVLDTFKSFEKEQHRLGIPKGQTPSVLQAPDTFHYRQLSIELSRIIRV